MHRVFQVLVLSGLLLIGLGARSSHANEVEIVHAVLTHAGGGKWRADVTLRHDDTGWEHYADAWRVIAEDGTVLGTRTLFHPHETEQPFTRSLSGIAVPEGATAVLIEAHDKVHEWSEQRVRVDLGKASGERFEVRR